MSLLFDIKDIKHKIAAKFVHAFLPDAKKAYNLKAVHQPELDIHGLASKAGIHDEGVDPIIIEQGMNAGFKLITYYVCDGFKIRTPLFTMRIRVPGEYDGSETHLPDGVHATIRMQLTPEFRRYLGENVTVEFDGYDGMDGHIGEALDEVTGLIDEAVTVSNLLTIRGFGLKIESDDANKGVVGLFFDPEEEPFQPVKAIIVAVNEPRTLKVIAPEDLKPNRAYRLKVVTQSSLKGSSSLLKEIREVRSDFKVIAQ